jgi:hypothetical protein
MEAELDSIMERTGAKYSLVTVGESLPAKEVGPPPYYARDRRRQRAIQTPPAVHEATDGGDGDLSMLSATISARYAHRAAQISVREPRSEDNQSNRHNAVIWTDCARCVRAVVPVRRLARGLGGRRCIQRWDWCVPCRCLSGHPVMRRVILG